MAKYVEPQITEIAKNASATCTRSERVLLAGKTPAAETLVIAGALMIGALPARRWGAWPLACNGLFVLYSLHESSAARVTSQVDLYHYHDSHLARLSPSRIRQPVCLARLRQQPGARRLRPHDRPSPEPVLARQFLASFSSGGYASPFCSAPHACRSSRVPPRRRRKSGCRPHPQRQRYPHAQ